HPDLGRRIAQLCDIYVNDAFATAHRKEATTYGVAEYAPIACAGPLLSAEYEAISLALEAPAKPLLAIVGGAKVSSKLAILENMADKVDGLIVGGGIANTFLLAKGYRVGKSLVQAEMVPIAERIIQKLKAKNATLLLPIDAVVSTEFSAHGNQRLVDIAEVAENEMILDLGPKSSAALDAYIGHAKTIIWNGPVGVFEWPAYAWGTQRLAQALACAQQAYTLAGGGETLAAIQQNRIADKLSYISTAGGAFLEMLEGKMLPAVEILHQRYLGQNDIFGNQ
ncbi:MAG: phosphoglycerate kinase, partial [Gammaproteobacteria bacterium]|nr:phosphoglycerate kinase [Gammaproteobacteria bacterium]